MRLRTSNIGELEGEHLVTQSDWYSLDAKVLVRNADGSWAMGHDLYEDEILANSRGVIITGKMPGNLSEKRLIPWDKVGYATKKWCIMSHAEQALTQRACILDTLLANDTTQYDILIFVFELNPLSNTQMLEHMRAVAAKLSRRYLPEECNGKTSISSERVFILAGLRAFSIAASMISVSSSLEELRETIKIIMRQTYLYDIANEMMDILAEFMHDQNDPGSIFLKDSLNPLNLYTTANMYAKIWECYQDENLQLKKAIDAIEFAYAAVKAQAEDTESPSHPDEFAKELPSQSGDFRKWFEDSGISHIVSAYTSGVPKADIIA